MVTRVWTGGYDLNLASDPLNWSTAGLGKHGAPKPGDSLVMSTGTMNIYGGNLAHDTLTIFTGQGQPGTDVTMLNANVKIDVLPSNGGISSFFPLFNAFGNDTVIYSGIGTSVFDIGGNSSLGGSFRGNIIVNGPGIFSPHSLILDNGSGATINADVRGAGTIELSGTPTSSSDIFFVGAVGKGQAVDVSSYSYVTIDKPTEFKASINLAANATSDAIELYGLGTADSYTLRKDLLSFSDASGKVIDTIHINAAANAIQAEVSVYGVYLFIGETAPTLSGWNILPYHGTGG